MNQAHSSPMAEPETLPSGLLTTLGSLSVKIKPNLSTLSLVKSHKFTWVKEGETHLLLSKSVDLAASHG
jgi:hypothetical protein